MTAELLSSETLTEITQQLWLAVAPDLGELAERPPSPEPAPGEEVAARIDITGTVEATVELSASRALLRRLAGAMFAAAPDELDQESLDDALGELVNIVGGNLKSLLPPPTGLSLPRIVASRGATGHLTCQSSLAWGEEPFVVRLLEGQRA